MHIAARKVYMSILTIILVLITTVATTYAWVGILTYNQIDEFDLNLKTFDLESDYYLSISATGEDSTFTDSASSDEIKEQILINMGKDLSIIPYDKSSNKDLYYETINDLFNKIGLHPVTVDKNKIFENDFHELNSKPNNMLSTAKSSSFFRFDLYLSVEAKNEESLTAAVNNRMDIMLSDIERVLTGTKQVYKIANDFYYPSENLLYDVDIPNYCIMNTQEVTIDTASATRLAIGIYDPIKRTESYPESEKPSKLVIYQGGTQNPTFEQSSNTYSFGGILPEEYNLALHEHKRKYNIGTDKLVVPTEMLERGDLELTTQNNLLIDSDHGFGIVNGEQMKMKLTIFFWYEGWDADCFEIISGQRTNINLTFATAEVVNV